jgi:hypothetical protein
MRDTYFLFQVIVLFSSKILKNTKTMWIFFVFCSFFLGFARRFLPQHSIFAGIIPGVDLLFLITTVMLLINWKFDYNRRFKGLEICVISIILISFLSVFNLVNSSFFVGIAGFIAFAIPILYFFVGENIGKALRINLMKYFFFFTVLTSLYGIFQVINGYPSWDQIWVNKSIDSGDYVIVGFAENRPFSTFSSVGEMCVVMSVGALCGSYLLKKKHLNGKFVYIFSQLSIVLCAALSASRGGLIFTLLGVFSQNLLNSNKFTTKAPLVKISISISILAIVLPVLTRAVAPYTNQIAQSLLSRQEAGLNGNASDVPTAFVHVIQSIEGVNSGVKSVIGFGVGKISGAQTLAGEARTNFEADFSNLIYAFGLLGIFLFTSLIFYLVRFSREQIKIQEWFIPTILIINSNNWTNPGHYSVNWFFWILLGSFYAEYNLNKQDSRTDA